MTQQATGRAIKFPSGQTGALVPSTVAVGDRITVTTKAGDSWCAYVTRIVMAQGNEVAVTFERREGPVNEDADKSAMDLLIEAREALTDELAECDRGAYPGTAMHERESAALSALSAFDRAHPEVVVEIRRRPRTDRI